MTESTSAGTDSTLGTDLPPNWALTTLGAVTDYGKTVKVEAEDIPAEAWVLELEDIQKDSSRILQRLSQSERQSLSTKNRFDAGDVLYGKLRPYLNKVVVADAPGFCTTEIVPVQAGPALERRYLFHWLKHPAFLKYVEAASHGMNMPRLGTDAGRAAPLVLAPRPEQTRIADQLDTLLARIQGCQDRLEAIPALLKRFRQAVLNSAVSGTLIDVDGGRGAAAWERTTVGAIARDVRYGTSKKCTYASTGHGVLRIPNIAQHGRIDLTDLKRADFDAKEVDKLALREGDLLVIRSNGSVDLVGACSVVTAAEAGLLFAGYLMRLRIDQTRALPVYVRICLSTSRQRELIERTAKSTSGVNNLNAEELRSLPLSLPTLGEQIAIVKRAEALLGLAAQIERRHAAATSNVLRLTPLTLAKAFRGELVPQDPNDEPASALLARIATQRNAPAGADSASTPRRGRPPRAPKETATMTKSRQDDDVMGQPYLAGHLRRIGTPASAEALFKVAELPVADFYKQLAWEVDQGHVKDNLTTLEPGHAAG